jgi:hypothetical protein
MALRHARGEPLTSIAVDFGVSKEAVRQALIRSGYVTPGAGERARKAQVAAADAARRAEVVAELERAPATLTRAEAATRFGMTQNTLAKLLGDDAKRLLRWSPGHRPAAYTDDQILDGLRAVAHALGTTTLTRAAYDDNRREVGDLASGVRVIQRFGTWSEANHRAGLDVGRGRPVYRNHQTDEQLLAYVRDYLTEAVDFSFNEYSRLAKARGWPSGSFIRARFGSWNVTKARAAGMRAPSTAQVDDAAGGPAL